jgi:hypothetical protein
MKLANNLDWLAVLPMTLLLAAIFAETGSYWQGFCVLAALFGIIIIYARENLGHAVKRSWLEKADLNNGHLCDAARQLDCYPEGSKPSGDSSHGRGQSHDVQEGLGHVRERGCGGPTPG